MSQYIIQCIETPTKPVTLEKTSVLSCLFSLSIVTIMNGATDLHFKLPLFCVCLCVLNDAGFSGK